MLVDYSVDPVNRHPPHIACVLRCTRCPSLLLYNMALEPPNIVTRRASLLYSQLHIDQQTRTWIQLHLCLSFSLHIFVYTYIHIFLSIPISLSLSFSPRLSNYIPSIVSCSLVGYMKNSYYLSASISWSFFPLAILPGPLLSAEVKTKESP